MWRTLAGSAPDVFLFLLRRPRLTARKGSSLTPGPPPALPGVREDRLLLPRGPRHKRRAHVPHVRRLGGPLPPSPVRRAPPRPARLTSAYPVNSAHPAALAPPPPPQRGEAEAPGGQQQQRVHEPRGGSPGPLRPQGRGAQGELCASTPAARCSCPDTASVASLRRATTSGGRWTRQAPRRSSPCTARPGGCLRLVSSCPRESAELTGCSLRSLAGPNQWPDEAVLLGWCDDETIIMRSLPGTRHHEGAARSAPRRRRDTMTEYFEACHAVGVRVIALLAQSLGLPPDHFQAPGARLVSAPHRCRGETPPYSGLRARARRVLRQAAALPPAAAVRAVRVGRGRGAPRGCARLCRPWFSGRRRGASRSLTDPTPPTVAGGHTDYGMITLLATDENPGAAAVLASAERPTNPTRA